MRDLSGKLHLERFYVDARTIFRVKHGHLVERASHIFGSGSDRITLLLVFCIHGTAAWTKPARMLGEERRLMPRGSEGALPSDRREALQTTRRFFINL